MDPQTANFKKIGDNLRNLRIENNLCRRDDGAPRIKEQSHFFTRQCFSC